MASSVDRIRSVWDHLLWADRTVVRTRTHAVCGRYLDRMRPEGLARRVTYTNSAGREFTNSVGEILLHVPLHGQYHRGKINLLLREAGLEPAAVDYIAWVRGVPAATEADTVSRKHGDNA